MKHIGKTYPVHDAVAKVTGRAVYTTDLIVPGMLTGSILFSDRAHARVKYIDCSEAESLEGVHAVCSYLNAPQQVYNSYHRFIGHDLPEDETIFSQEVRYIGDRIAAVAAETPEIARKALRLIKVEYEELPAVFSIDDAEGDDSPRVNSKYPNRCPDIKLETGDVTKGFSEADFVFEDTYYTPAIYHAALENHCAIADYSPDNHLTVWCTSQNIFATRMLLGKLFDLPRNRVQVKKPILGGAFGGKVPMSVEPVAALLSKLAGRPVKVELTRREDMNGTNTRHASKAKIKTGIKKDGQITAQEIKFLVNTGAYHTGGNSIASAICYKLYQLYKNINLKINAAPVYTNTTPAGAMRGYGAPQMMFAHQVHLNKIARQLGIDFTDLQLKNLIEPNSTNHLTNSSQGNVRGIDCVIKGKKLFEWDKRSQQTADGYLKRGIGMAVCSLWNGVFGVHIDATGIRITMNEDGTFIVHTPTHDMGQGTSIAIIQIVAEVLSVQIGDIRIVESDTDSCLWDLGAFASRGIYVSGEAARVTAEKMKAELLKHAAENFKKDPVQLQLKDGQIIQKSDLSMVAKLADFANDLLLKKNIYLEVNHFYSSEADRTSNAAHFAEVEVNTETGEVKVLDYLAVHDIGQVINKIGVEGQIEGGVQMGLGFALSEEMIRDEKGRLKNPNFKKYKMFRASEMPEIRLSFIEEKDYPGPFGAKSISEIATVPVAPAIVNAIVDALGENFYALPIRPEHLKSKK
jgi:CO/xanthine dehydrogenase Mo-binding subunit